VGVLEGRNYRSIPDWRPHGTTNAQTVPCAGYKFKPEEDWVTPLDETPDCVSEHGTFVMACVQSVRAWDTLRVGLLSELKTCWQMCEKGYTGANCSSCVACPDGQYKDTAGAAACSSCPTGSGSTFARTSCVCEPGYTGPDGHSGSCAACDAGKYKAEWGEAACVHCTAGSVAGAAAVSCLPCAPGTYADSAQTSCSACPEASFSPANSSDVRNCTCNIGYTGIFFL
jgi:hypothetical protein